MGDRAFKTFGEQLVAASKDNLEHDIQPDLAREIERAIWGESSQFGYSTNGVLSLMKGVRSIQIGKKAKGMAFNAMMKPSARDYWLHQADFKSASKPKFRQINFKFNKLIGLCYGAEALFEDPYGLGKEIGLSLVVEARFRIAQSIIHGTGIKQPLGILNSPATITVKRWRKKLTRRQLWKMQKHLFISGDAQWWVKWDHLERLQKMGLYPLCFGRKVNTSEMMNVPGMRGDVLLIDFDGYLAVRPTYEEGSEQKMTVQYLEDPKDKDGVFRFTHHYDGQSVLAKPVIPYKSTRGSGLSHFVALS